MGKFVAKKYVIEVTADRHEEMHRLRTDHDHVERQRDRWVRAPLTTNAIAGPQTATMRGVR